MSGRERPILFSAPMVRAIRDGRKTQTRRIVKGDPVEMVRFIGADDRPTGEFGRCLTHTRVINDHVRCPYGLPGDRLWVREAFAPVLGGASAIYRADGERQPGACCGCAWKPSIHMPRALSRITLEITEVRVERLNDCSPADALAEGLTSAPGGWWSGHEGSAAPDPVSAYAMLWEHINGEGSWDANPWVWVVEFRRSETDRAVEPQKAAHVTARELNTSKYSPNQHHPSPSASAGGDGEEHQS